MHRFVLIALASACTATPLLAQRVELAPFAGYRLGGAVRNVLTNVTYNVQPDLSYGATVEFATGSGVNRVVVLFSRQETTVDTIGGLVPVTIDYLHVGGSRDLKGTGSTRPFVTGALGVGIASAPGTAIGSRTRFGLSGGIGIKAPANSRLGLRLEARGNLTFVGESEAAGTCGGGGCAIAFQSGTLFQAEGLAGVALRF